MSDHTPQWEAIANRTRMDRSLLFAAIQNGLSLQWLERLGVLDPQLDASIPAAWGIRWRGDDPTMSTPEPALRLAKRLRDNPNVVGVRFDGSTLWVQLERWNREERFRVYEAVEAANGADGVSLMVTDNPSEVPSAAKALFTRDAR